MKFDYGTCPCGGNYEERSVQIRMTVGDKPIVFYDASQGACSLCGSRVYKADLLEYIEATMKGKQITIRLD